MNRPKKVAKTARDTAMPEVRKLVSKHGKSAIYGCLLKMSEEAMKRRVAKEVKLPKDFGKMK